MVTGTPCTPGAYGAYRAYGAGVVPVLVPVLMVLVGCQYTPAGRERMHAYQTLRLLPEVLEATVGCEGAVLASDSLCADVVLKEGAKLRFEKVGYGAFGPNAVNVVIAEAGGLVPRMASCAAVGAPNFHRQGAVGHHFSPTLIDVKEAVTRWKEVLEEVQYWPQCPLFWEVQDRRGTNYRYCARRPDRSEDPPRPEGCERSN